MAKILDRCYALYVRKHGSEVPPELVASRCATELMTDENFAEIVGPEKHRCVVLLGIAVLTCIVAAVLTRKFQHVLFSL